jgi:CO/xanthine dehydrogenase FAD-binding subunit
MKPAPFDYVRAETLEHALAVLSEHGEEVKVLAGGQSLLPLMNFRLAVPSVILDIGRLDELAQLTSEGGATTIGALVRHRAMETSNIKGAAGDLFRLAGRWIGHLPVRLRGTVGGSLAHADPAAEWCSVMHVLDARVHLRSSQAERDVPITGFLEGFLTTALHADELVVRIDVPTVARTARAGFSEYSRRSGDFALALAAVVVDIDGDAIRTARITVGGGPDGPFRAQAAEERLAGASPADRVSVEEAARLAGEALDCPSTPVISPAGRRRLVRTCVLRALEQAAGTDRRGIAA